MISASTDAQQQETLIEKYMQLPNQVSLNVILLYQGRLVWRCKFPLANLYSSRKNLFSQVWDDIINQASKNVDVLKDQEAVKQLGSILKTNVRACKALGHPFVSQLGRIYLDMLNVYKVCYVFITCIAESRYSNNF